MDFSDITFWLMLIPPLFVLAIGDYLLKGKEKEKCLFHRILILILSLSLLAFISIRTLGIFLLVTQIAYLMCLWGQQKEKFKQKILLCILIPLLLLPLLYYKYGHFIGVNVFNAHWDTLRDLLIPVGISFYTFQIVGFCIDTLMRNQPVPSWLDYMNFSSYFPQIVAGPIERRDNLLGQVKKMELKLTKENFNVGLRYICLGLFFKIALADMLAGAFWESYPHNSAWIIWLNNLLFTFRIYFDFAGYGIIAYGVARCMGITLCMNFLSPYTASNITEFWRRWHTSLTTWFRDYIYFPIGGSRTKLWAFNIFFVFMVSGLWHGANWNFIIWGGLAGVGMVIHRVFYKRKLRLWTPLAWVITFGMMVFIWMFFYDSNMELLRQHLSYLMDPSRYGVKEFIEDFMRPERTSSNALALIYLPLSFCVIFFEGISLRRTGDPYRLFLSTPVCGIMTFILTLSYSEVSSQFIYFSF